MYLTFGVLLTTGIGWLLLDWLVRVPGDFGPEHHPAEHWLLLFHGVVAYAFLIVAGTIIPAHLLPGWKIGRNLKSGVSLAAAFLLLTGTALGLYYLTGDASRSWVSIVHWSIGIAALPVLLVHALKGRRLT
ncbi:MAG: hypothetical protein ABIQ32_10560 [Sphingomicrobium sp.]